ncbi:MAG: magnesium transporter [Methyloceanibacter sp.]|jgi:magnesium transporter
MNDAVDASSPFDPAEFAAALAQEHVADIVERLNAEPLERASAVLSAMPLERAAEVLDEPGLEAAADLVESQPSERAITLLKALSADQRADIFRHLGAPARERLLSQLDAETRTSLVQLLSYPENTAGSIMTTEFVSVPSSWTVGETLRHIRAVESTRETIYAIYVLNPKTKALIKAVSLRRLIVSEPHVSVLSIAPPRRPVTVSPFADREEVARLISKYDLLAVPVVSRGGHVLGIVTVDDIIDAIVEENTEDVQKFGGMEALDAPYMDIGFFEMIQKRAGWLCVLFVSEMLTASAMQHFQDELQKAIVLTLFIPLIMSSGGNSGSQATSLLIRAIALREMRLRDWWRVALRELPTGLTLGAILGLLGIMRIALWQKLGLFDYGEHWLLIACTVGAALVGIVTFGSLVGSMLPFILKRIGFDPASASAPFVATLVDVSGLVIYFSIALVFLRGTLL